jgi:hypothetical protein
MIFNVQEHFQMSTGQSFLFWKNYFLICNCRQIAVLMKGHRLFESEVIELCDKAIKILAAEDNVPNIAPPVTVSQLFINLYYSFFLRSVATFMVNCLILLNCFTSAVHYRTQTMSFWAIMSIVDCIRLKRFNY